MSKTLHVVSILDRSGSMTGSEREVIGAYNSFIETQKQLAKDKKIKMKTTLILFDNIYEEVYSKVPVEQTPLLTSETYCTRGMTAYLDAIGKTIATFEGKQKVIFFIETDGLENASKEYTLSSLKTLVEKKTKDGWDFNFVGADLSSADVSNMGSSIGISSDKTAAFAKSASVYSTRNMMFADSTVAYANKVETMQSTSNDKAAAKE